MGSGVSSGEWNGKELGGEWSGREGVGSGEWSEKEGGGLWAVEEMGRGQWAGGRWWVVGRELVVEK